MNALNRIIFTVTLAIFIVASVTLGVDSATGQCNNPTGWFASEVLLSKPRVSYDFTMLEETGNVIAIRSSVLYRSHYDERVAVILTPLEVFEEKGLDVRLQLPTKTVTTTTQYLKLEANVTVKVADLNMLGGRYINWVLDLNYLPNPGEGPPIQVSNLTKGNLRVTFRPYKNETIPDTYIRIEAKNTTALSEQNRTELSQIFDAIGYPTSFDTLIKGFKSKSLTRTTEDLASSIDVNPRDFEWGEAMKIELEWLRRNRVIIGLTNGDIETISALARYAWGEHNFKARWYNDGWVIGITEEMLNERFTYEYQGSPNCAGFESAILPAATIEDFNAGFQPLEMILEESFTGAGIRTALIGGAVLTVFIVYIRRRRLRR